MIDGCGFQIFDTDAGVGGGGGGGGGDTKYAREYWVEPNEGDDANPGTEGSRLQTILEAVTQAKASGILTAGTTGFADPDKRILIHLPNGGIADEGVLVDGLGIDFKSDGKFEWESTSSSSPLELGASDNRFYGIKFNYKGGANAEAVKCTNTSTVQSGLHEFVDCEAIYDQAAGGSLGYGFNYTPGTSQGLYARRLVGKSKGNNRKGIRILVTGANAVLDVDDLFGQDFSTSQDGYGISISATSIARVSLGRLNGLAADATAIEIDTDGANAPVNIGSIQAIRSLTASDTAPCLQFLGSALNVVGRALVVSNGNSDYPIAGSGGANVSMGAVDVLLGNWTFQAVKFNGGNLDIAYLNIDPGSSAVGSGPLVYAQNSAKINIWGGGFKYDGATNFFAGSTGGIFQADGSSDLNVYGGRWAITTATGTPVFNVKAGASGTCNIGPMYVETNGFQWLEMQGGTVLDFGVFCDSATATAAPNIGGGTYKETGVADKGPSTFFSDSDTPQKLTAAQDTFTLITGSANTPPRGNWMIRWNVQGSAQDSGSAIQIEVGVFYDGVLQKSRIRGALAIGGEPGGWSRSTPVTADGTKVVELRFRRVAASGTANPQIDNYDCEVAARVPQS